ncbi:MAG: hypothetical protein JO285_02765 [Kutzneria sp.]|nr:hypothetical protein [Kutzneria sp.]
MSVRTVLRARTDGADRMLIMNVGDDPCGVRPVFTPDASCRLGRTVYSPEDDMTAVELMFRRPLRTGETYLVEYQVAGANPRIRITELTVGLRQPTRECVLQVLFRPGSLPARCYPVWQPGTGRPARAAHTTEQHIESDGSTHVVLLDVPAGRYGLRWDWN